eukprot:GHRR01032232.1.p1 GENE.GHRR01032232.1~~GHRR01032232.1.p1  ORF type:complete len:105 (-),score=23.74 GHRR01032232.1:463-777(-)
MERSVFSDRMVFVRAVRESGWMGDVELAVYDSWFNPILETNPQLVPDGFIYLKCDPSTCMQRSVSVSPWYHKKIALQQDANTYVHSNYTSHLTLLTSTCGRTAH